MVDELKCGIKIAYASAKDQTSLLPAHFSPYWDIQNYNSNLRGGLVYVVIAFN